jgi:acetolactate synthase small subunit
MIKAVNLLRVISRETTAREELADTIDKFAALAADRKKKVVSFQVKDDDDK